MSEGRTFLKSFGKACLVLGFVGISCLSFSGNKESKDIDKIRLVAAIDTLIHSYQAERGSSVSFLSAKSKGNPSILLDLHENADNNLDIVKERLEICNVQLSPKALDLVAQITPLRESIANFSISPKDVAKRYTDTIYEFLRTIKEDIAPTIQDQKASAGLASHMFLMVGKDFCGRERAAVSGILNSNKAIDADTMKVWNKLIAEQVANLDDKFVNSADKGLVAMYNEIKADKAYTGATDLQKAIMAKAETGNFDVTTPQWWAAKTSVMNLLKKLDEKSIQNLLSLYSN